MPRSLQTVPEFLANMPIKRKLMVIIMGVTAAALLISGFSIAVFDSVLFHRYLQRDLSALARITADNSTAALSFEDPQSADETLTALRARTHVVSACIYRPNGEVFARYSRPGTSESCPPVGADDLVEVGTREISLSRPIMLAERRIGTLVLLYDLQELFDRRQLYGASVLAILLISGFIAFLLTSSLRKVIADPISELAFTTVAVSETRDYSIRADKLSQDELGVLVDAFNGMLAGIQSRDQELRHALIAREEALREAQNARDLLKTTLASIGDAVVSTDANGAVVFANPVACSMMRCPEENIVGSQLNDVLRLVDERTGEPIESPVTRVLREGISSGVTIHTSLVASDGAEVPIDDSAAPIRNRSGDLMGVVLIFRDITERRRAEQQLRSTREQLQLVTDTMAAAVAHCSRDLNYVWVSRRYAEWLKTTPEAVAGRPIADLLGREAFEVIRPNIERALAGERVDYETRLNYATIGTRWVRAVYVATHDQSGAVDGWVADVTDITEIKTAEAELARVNANLRRSNDSLARSNEDLARFAFAVSHDLQEPLRMITSYVQLLVRTFPGQFEGEASMFVRNVLDGATRMRGLLADLLTYSEIGADLDTPLEVVDLNVIFEGARDNLRLAADETGATIDCDALPRVHGYAAHFVQLFQNLLGNAIKYRGNAPPRIQITFAREGGWLRFAVQDNGIGIDPEYHARIFGVFKRLHGKKIPGTGIGLAICQRVVERYGGRIWVESQSGHGATFLFTLPEDVGVFERVADGRGTAAAT